MHNKIVEDQKKGASGSVTQPVAELLGSKCFKRVGLRNKAVSMRRRLVEFVSAISIELQGFKV